MTDHQWDDGSPASCKRCGQWDDGRVRDIVCPGTKTTSPSDRSTLDPGFASMVERVTKQQARAEPRGYGKDYVVVTEKDLDHLRAGGVLAWSDGEYWHGMELVDDSDDDD